MLTDDQSLRYSRHLLLDDWSEEAQGRLLRSTALVVGAGGLGAPALMYLAAAGVGTLVVLDPDVVELSNLQRQVLHSTASVGQPKVVSAAEGLGRLNPGVTVHAVPEAADEALLAHWLPLADVVLDCTDQFATRHLINRACARARKPLVSASALQFDGQISLFDHRQPQAPCYACLFPPDRPPEETRCALMGVFAPLVGFMGVWQAGEALKLLAGLHDAPVEGGAPRHRSLAGRLLMVDGRRWEVQEMGFAATPGCPVCAQRFSAAP